ncbi:Hypothetical predicted protein, partial [Marmota monax]
LDLALNPWDILDLTFQNVPDPDSAQVVDRETHQKKRLRHRRFLRNFTKEATRVQHPEEVRERMREFSGRRTDDKLRLDVTYIHNQKIETFFCFKFNA